MSEQEEKPFVKPKRVSREQIAAEVAALQRDGFRRVIVDLMEAAPDVEDLQLFAKRNPDKWARCVAAMAPLAGFQQDSVAQTNILVVNQLPDSDLAIRMQETERKLAELQRAKALENATQQPELPQRTIEADQNIVDVIATEVDVPQTVAEIQQAEGGG